MFREDSWRLMGPHPIGVSALTLSTLSDFACRVGAWGRAIVDPPRAPASQTGSRRLPDYPTRCAACHGVPARRGGRVAGSRLARRWPPSSRSAAAAAPRAAASRWPRRAASAPAPWRPSPRPAGVRAWAPPPRRVLVYVGALALVGARLVRLDRLVADAADLLRRRQPLARRRRGRGRRRPARRPAAPPARGRRVGALRRLAAARRLRDPAARARRLLPDLAAAAGRARLSRTRSAPTRRSRRPRALWLASSPQRARRVAGCGTLALLVLGLGARLLARRHAGRGDRLRRLAGRQRPAHRERRRAARRARRERPGRALGHSTCTPSRRSTRRSPCPPASRLRLVLARRPCSPPRCSGPLAVELAQRAGARARRICGLAVLAVAVVGVLLAAVRLSSQHGGPGGALSHVWHQLSGGGAVGSTDHLTRSRRTCAAAGGARPGTASPRTRCSGNGADTFETIDRLARPDFQQAGQEHSAVLARALGPRAAGRHPGGRSRWRAAGACLRRRHAPARQPSAPPRSRSWPASAPSRCTTRSTGSGSRPR